MALNTTRWNVIHAYDTSSLESKILIRFALWPAVFELCVILQQVLWITPNDLENYKVKGSP